MSSSAEATGASLDLAKLAVAALLLVGGIFAFYLLDAWPSWLRTIGLLAIAGGAAAVAYRTQRGRQLWQFVSDARMEVRKVVWPTRQETVQTTLVVMAMVVALGIVLWLFDMILMGILRFLTGHGG